MWSPNVFFFFLVPKGASEYVITQGCRTLTYMAPGSEPKRGAERAEPLSQEGGQAGGAAAQRAELL